MYLKQLEVPFTANHSKLHLINDAVSLADGLHEVEDAIETPLQSQRLHQTASDSIILSGSIARVVKLILSLDD